MKYGSDLVAEILAALDIPFIALNPGSTFRGLHDSLVNHPSTPMPEIIECTHEEISVAIAHGYAKATGKLMGVALHNTVGLQHATMAIFNAWCDRVPMFILGGSGPDAIEKRRYIDWIHSASVQGQQIRDYVKFDDQPVSIRSVPDSMYRAYRLSVTEPAAPVYIALDMALQEDSIAEEDLHRFPELAGPLDPNMFRPGVAPAADPEAVDMIANAIRHATFPVMITDHSGRNAEGFELLREIADQWSIPVIDHGGRLNFPTNHPMNLSWDRKEVLAQADVVIALDMRDLHSSLHQADHATSTFIPVTLPHSKIFSIGVQDYGVRSWSKDYHRLCPTTASVLADSRIFLKQLKASLGDAGESDYAQTVRHRKDRVTKWHNKLRKQAVERAIENSKQSPIALSSFAMEIWKVIKEKEFVLANGNLRGWANRIFDLDQPHQYLGASGGAGLGYGIGATIGAALAHRDSGKLVVNIQSDGDLMFTPGGLWTLAHHKLPALIIMNNNRTYFNSEDHQVKVARHRNRDISKAGIGTELVDPEINFVQMANSMGVHAIGPVEHVSDIGEALREAIDYIEKNRLPVLVDVITSKLI